MIARYTRPQMEKIWNDDFKFSTWLKIEILACEAREKLGEILKADIQIIKHKAKFDAKRILEIEETTQHDVIAFLTNVAEYVGPESRHIHFGMTSSDILDTTLSFQMKAAGELLLEGMLELKNILKEKAIENKELFCIGRTHGIHAEPTTLGLKFAIWFEETKRNIQRLKRAIEIISVGQISGAVGTFEHLSPKVEEYVCKKMNLKPAPISTQILQRDRHAEYVSTLAIIGGTLEKIATEIRHLQKTEVLELEEFFSKGQKGSSAMPHKRNPIICERIAGMSRILRGNSLAALENICLWHERDITHSSVERVVIPDSCMLLDYMLSKMNSLLKNLLVYPKNMMFNLNLTRGLIFSQKVLLALIKEGASREEAYSIVQKTAMEVWRDKSKSLKDELLKSNEVRKFLNKNKLNEIFDNSKMIKNVDYIFKRTVLAD